MSDELNHDFWMIIENLSFFVSIISIFKEDKEQCNVNKKLKKKTYQYYDKWNPNARGQFSSHQSWLISSRMSSKLVRNKSANAINIGETMDHTLLCWRSYKMFNLNIVAIMRRSYQYQRFERRRESTVIVQRGEILASRAFILVSLIQMNCLNWGECSSIYAFFFRSFFLY